MAGVLTGNPSLPLWETPLKRTSRFDERNVANGYLLVNVCYWCVIVGERVYLIELYDWYSYITTQLVPAGIAGYILMKSLRDSYYWEIWLY